MSNAKVRNYEVDGHYDLSPSENKNLRGDFEVNPEGRLVGLLRSSSNGLSEDKIAVGTMNNRTLKMLCFSTHPEIAPHLFHLQKDSEIGGYRGNWAPVNNGMTAKDIISGIRKGELKYSLEEVEDALELTEVDDKLEALRDINFKVARRNVNSKYISDCLGQKRNAVVYLK